MAQFAIASMCMLSTVAVGSVNPVDEDDDDDDDDGDDDVGDDDDDDDDDDDADDFDDDGDDDVGDDGVEIENGKFVTILPPSPDAAI